MATQAEGFPSVKFSVSSTFRNVRLIEVPEDVLSIITATPDASASRPILKFKSAPASTSIPALARNSSTSKAKDSILHLCSDDKAWAIKQVSTSNSVYVIQPDSPSIHSEAARTDINGDTAMEDINDDLEDATLGSVTATSQIRNFLELHPVEIHQREITEAILDLVPIYHCTSEDDGILGKRRSALTSISQIVLIENIAAPDSLVHKNCASLCLFELITDDTNHNEPQCYIPSPTSLLETWSKITEACAIDLIKLDHAINIDRILDTLDTAEHKAITKSMLNPHGMFAHLHLFEHASTSLTSDATALGTQYLKPKQTSQFIAEMILRSIEYDHLSNTDEISNDPQTKQEGINLSTFTYQWTKLVPEPFVKLCTTDTLNALNHISINEATTTQSATIKWSGPRTREDLISIPYLLGSDGDGNGISTLASTGSITSAAETKQPSSMKNAASAGKRKWHEKFGAQRNAKK